MLPKAGRSPARRLRAEALTELHSFTESGPPVYDAYNVEDGHRRPKPVGNGAVTCERCGLVLPTQDGVVLPDWNQYIAGFNCMEAMVDHVHGR